MWKKINGTGDEGRGTRDGGRETGDERRGTGDIKHILPYSLPLMISCDIRLLFLNLALQTLRRSSSENNYLKMKKIYTLIAATLIGSAMFAQNSFSDDFESYNVGDYLGPQPQWTTWSGASSTTEDTQVNNVMNNTPSGSKSCKWVSTSSTGGPQDCILPFGGTRTTGNFVYQMSMFIESGQGGYFNFQGTTTPGQIFSIECYMNQLGDMYVVNTTDGILLQTTYPTNTWFDLKYDINLNSNQWDVYINNVIVGSFSNSTNTIGAIDIFAYNGANYGGNNNASFYIDDVSYTYTPYTLPAINGAVTNVTGVSPGLATQSRNANVVVRNLGTTTITSYDLTLNYNSGQFSQSLTGQNLASLATATITLTTPVVLAPGSMPLTVTISNVNGNSTDGDPTDDAKTITVNPVVPAPGRVVVGEEATGTWCPWCVRGTVFMDYMENTYDGFWAGIAVHNNDPMTVTAYDAAIGGYISGYPSALIDRTPAIDPSAMESPFLTRVQIPGAANITNTASVNGNTLTVNVTYTFPNAMSGTGYKYACILTEDSVTGVGSNWSQNNAYAGGANGPMGGFESLLNPVSYTLMHYDHVARALNPSWAGTAGFPASITTGQAITFPFTFTVDPTWNLSRMHVIGILIDPSNEIDNAGITSMYDLLGLSIGENTGIPSNFRLFPNPTSNGTTYANVELTSTENVSMKIIDLTGAVVAEKNYGQMSGTNLLPIETVNFAKGIYFVQIQTGTVVSSQKLIVQ
ncbi:hypothetical protein BH09BAC5_BH09BAC5_11920 [soil metagenome]